MKFKLLMVSWTLYPATSGSSVLVSNLAAGFGPGEEVVLAGQRPAHAPAIRWEEHSAVPLHYLDPLPFGIARGQKYTRWLRLSAVVTELKRIIKSAEITHVLAIFPDEFFCQAARLAALDMQVPYSIWLHNSYLENRSGWLKRLAAVLQPRFFRDARHVFVMSDGLGRELAKNYPGQDFITLPHGFPVTKTSQPTDVSLNPQRVKYLYSGSLNDSCLDASLRLLRVVMARPESEVHLSTGNPEAFSKAGIDLSKVTVHDFLPMDEFLASLRQYDILLLPHGIDGPRSNFEYKTIFPTRAVPLLFSGKPIFAHSPEQSYLTDFLRQHDCAQLVTEKSDIALDNALSELLTNSSLRQRLVANAQPAAQRFTLTSVVAKLKLHCGT